MSSILDAALKYRELGYTPIPLDGKKPRFDGWSKERSVSESQVREWFADGANVGIVCGEASKNLVVLDCDGLPNYAAFCERFPVMAETYTVITGSGKGMHLYFYVDDLPPITDAKAINGDKESNIEIKPNGRQVVAPPSIHPDTKQPYEVHRKLPIVHLPDFWEVVDWVRSYQSSEAWTPPDHVTYDSGDKELNPAVLDALHSHFEGGRHKLHKDWINCPCPNHLAHSHGDQHPTFGYNTRSGWGHCFRCGTISTKALCEYTHIDWKALGGLFKNNPVQQKKSEWVNIDLPPTDSPLAAYGVSRSEGLAEYNRRLLSKEPIAFPPLVAPLSALHHLGGYCRVIPPGRLVFVVGSSGTGKTSMLETIADKWTVRGYNLIVWSPEWSSAELVERAVQRQGGATLEQIYLHQVALSDISRGYSRTEGVLMSEKMRSDSIDKAEDLALSMGETFYLAAKELTSLDFKTILPDVMKALQVAQNRRYQAVLLDYAQLMHACENKDVSMYQVLMRIKQACLACNLVGVVATQTTKSDTRAKDRSNQLLDSSSARFVNEDASNMFVTLNLEKTPPGGGTAYSTGVLNVTKNSIGRKGKVRVFTDFERLAWLDKKHHNQDMAEYEED